MTLTARLLYWVNILLFPILVFRLLSILLGIDLERAKDVWIYLAFAGWLYILILASRRAGVGKFSKLFVSIVFVSLALPAAGVGFLAFTEPEGGWLMLGLVILGLLFAGFIVLTLIFLQALHGNSGQGAASTPPVRRTALVSTALVVALFVLPYLEFRYPAFCNRDVCRYAIFHENPDLCLQKTYAYHHCYVETAMYYGDPAYCEHIVLERTPIWDYQQSLVEIEKRCEKSPGEAFCLGGERQEKRQEIAAFQPDAALEGAIARCKRWASKPNARDLLNDKDYMPAWMSEEQPGIKE